MYARPSERQRQNFLRGESVKFNTTNFLTGNKHEQQTDRSKTWAKRSGRYQIPRNRFPNSRDIRYCVFSFENPYCCNTVCTCQHHPVCHRMYMNSSQLTNTEELQCLVAACGRGYININIIIHCTVGSSAIWVVGARSNNDNGSRQ